MSSEPQPAVSPPPTVLLLASGAPDAARIKDAARRLRDAGARVLVAAPRLDAHLTGQARTADLVVPLDDDARPAARRLAERHRGLRLVPRPQRAVALLRDGAVTVGSSGSRGRRGWPEQLPLPLLQRLLTLPGLPEHRRARLSRTVADRLGDVVSSSLAEGHGSGVVRGAYAAELAVADDHLTRGEIDDAAWSFGEAVRTAFHTSVHFDALSSPLADDPAGFTAPLRDSRVAQVLRAPAGRREAAVTPAGRPTRLLIAVRGTEMFAAQIRQHFEGLSDFETRYVGFPELPGLMKFVNNPDRWAAQLLGGRSELVDAAEQLLRPHLDWADVVFVDWCSQLAALFTRVDPGRTRVVVRLHSYEPFTRWPHLVDFSRVDDIVFVSEHLQRLAVASVPGLVGAGTRQHVIANAADLQPMVRPKEADARFTLALVGASKMVKDPRWTIEVLRLLRAHDPRYRLKLIGGRFQDTSAAVHDYASALADDVAELGESVERIRFTEDVPGALQGVGVILSSSVRESFHLGLAEGAASGAVPVVRNWPFFPGAPAELFPADWVVDTPEQAAARILETTASEELWRDEGARASREVLGKWDWSVVAPGYEELLRARPPRGSGRAGGGGEHA